MGQEKNETKKVSGLSGKVWVPVVYLIGTIAGIVSYMYTLSTLEAPDRAGFWILLRSSSTTPYYPRSAFRF